MTTKNILLTTIIVAPILLVAAAWGYNRNLIDCPSCGIFDRIALVSAIDEVRPMLDKKEDRALLDRASSQKFAVGMICPIEVEHFKDEKGNTISYSARAGANCSIEASCSSSQIVAAMSKGGMILQSCALKRVQNSGSAKILFVAQLMEHQTKHELEKVKWRSKFVGSRDDALRSSILRLQGLASQARLDKDPRSIDFDDAADEAKMRLMHQPNKMGIHFLWPKRESSSNPLTEDRF